MVRKFVHTIREEDVGKARIETPGCKYCEARGPVLYLHDWFGPVQAHDVGKRIFNVDGVLQAESDDQLKARQEIVRGPYDWADDINPYSWEEEALAIATRFLSNPEEVLTLIESWSPSTIVSFATLLTYDRKYWDVRREIQNALCDRETERARGRS